MRGTNGVAEVERRTSQRAATSRHPHRSAPQHVGAIIAITREDLEGLVSSSRISGRWGCECSCHATAPLVSVHPRTASFSKLGGTSQHTVTNRGKTRVAVKIKCSDNKLYKVSPVFAFIDSGQSVGLSIARGEGAAKKDKLVVMILETTAQAQDPRVVYDVCGSRPMSLPGCFKCARNLIFL
ncbi:unnamed protein product, partial [Mesorhabditis belari]|uniref:Major sperm protein n=1 Tax=Mesorhabditis belari TaxID=2138241 RepID=A0AAF3E8T5_9BILA